LAEAIEEARAHPGMTIVPGIEINCDVAHGEVHILGYCVDWGAEWFQAFLATQRRARAARVEKICARLAELGMPVTPTEVFAIVKEGSPGRPHVAQAMMDRGYVKSIREAFDRYLQSGGPAHVPRERLTPAEAVGVIRRARGVPVFAHPGLGDHDALIPELVAAGLMGIECWYNEHSASQTTKYLELCRRQGLVATGGSDYHGPHVGRANEPGIPVVDLAVWEELRRAAERAAAA
jgi:predicted metal-dependent phosphoesterase TrpH